MVPEGEGWHHPPYAAEIEGGRLYGRGSIDDKGPVVASLFALKAIRDLGIPLNRRVRLLFGLNEETNDRDVLYYKAHGGELHIQGKSWNIHRIITYRSSRLSSVSQALHVAKGSAQHQIPLPF